MKIYEYKTKATLVREIPDAKVCSVEAAWGYLVGAFDTHPEQESFWVLFLNNKNVIKGRQMLTLGTQVGTLCSPREVFRAALAANAMAIVCAHNHPSGDPAPSCADIEVTKQLRLAAMAIDIKLIDHIIIGDRKSDPLGKGYYSFRENGIV